MACYFYHFGYFLQVILPPVLARVPQWREQVIKCQTFQHFAIGRRLNLLSYSSSFSSSNLKVSSNVALFTNALHDWDQNQRDTEKIRPDYKQSCHGIILSTKPIILYKDYTISTMYAFQTAVTELNNVCACAETGEVWDLNQYRLQKDFQNISTFWRLLRWILNI